MNPTDPKLGFFLDGVTLPFILALVMLKISYANADRIIETMLIKIV
ncbi:MAG: hypothetical protein AAFO76_13680 [Cyanobacteria bacterium J06607_15]